MIFWQRLIFLIPFFLFPQSYFAQANTNSYKYMWTLSLGSSYFQNNLNDSKNTTYNDSLFYLNLTSPNKYEFPEYNYLFYKNKNELNKENTSQSFASALNIRMNFDYFISKYFTIGFLYGVSGGNNNRTLRDYYPAGGYILLSQYYDKNPITLPLLTKQSYRSFNQYLPSIGYITKLFNLDFQTRLYLGTTIMRYGRSTISPSTDCPTVGFSLGIALPIGSSTTDDKEKKDQFISFELSGFKYYIPGDYQNKFTQRLESNGYLTVNEYNLNIGYREALVIGESKEK